MSTLLPRLNRRVLTVFLLVSLPAFIVGVAVVLAIGQARLRDAGGRHLEDVAHQTAASVDHYVYRRILDVSLIGRSPELRQEAALGSARPVDQKRIEAIDSDWVNRRADLPEKVSLLRSPASRFLADLVAQDRIYREMLLTDRVGRLVAASAETSDYFQADEDWWKAAAGDGHTPGASVSDVRWDDSSRTLGVEIAVPVFEPDSNVFAGLLKAVVDSRELLAVVGGVQLGNTGEAALLRRNGTIVFSREVGDPNARFAGAETMRDRLAAQPEGEMLSGASFRVLPAGGEARMVGIAPSQLGRSYDNLQWVVAVSQDESELLAPMQRVGWYLLGVVGLTAAMLLLAALYFSLRLSSSVTEDLVLVERARVSHVGDEHAADASVPPRDVPPNVRMAG